MKKASLAAVLSLWCALANAAITFSTNNPMAFNNGFASYAGGAGNYVASFAALSNPSVEFMLIYLSAGVTVTSVGDSQSQTWHIVGPSASSAGYQGWMIYCNNTTTNTDYVYLNLTGGPSAGGFSTIFGELLGAPTSSPLVASNTATGTGSSATLNLTSLVSGDAIVASIFTANGGSGSPTTGSGFTGSNGNNATNGYGLEYLLSTGAGTVAVPFGSGGSGAWNEVALAFGTSGSSCTHTGWNLATGAFSTPTAGSGTFWLSSGASGSTDCSATQYWQPSGAFGAN